MEPVPPVLEKLMKGLQGLDPDVFKLLMDNFMQSKGLLTREREENEQLCAALRQIAEMPLGDHRAKQVAESALNASLTETKRKRIDRFRLSIDH